jgi:hypothetical protein
LHECRILLSERNRSAGETRNGHGAMSGLSLKCASNTKSIGPSAFAVRRPRASSVTDRRMGGAKRYPSKPAQKMMGFACALPILRSLKFLPLLAPSRARTARSNCCSVKTLIAIPARSRSSTLCESSAPAAILSAVRIHWRCRCPSRAQEPGYGRFAFLQVNSRKGVQKNGVHQCWHEPCIG